MAHSAPATSSASTSSSSPQLVTPELRAWINEQTALGFSQAAVLEAMCTAGWHPELARQALEAPVADPSADALPSAVPVPWPDGAGLRAQLAAGDRTVTALVVMDEPAVLVLDGLLTAGECAELMQAAARRLSRSLTVDVKTGGEEENIDRTSQGMFFSRGETPLISRLEDRIAALLGWPVQNGEGLQVLRYGPGAEYKPHYDYFDPAEPGTPSILARGGQRVATLIMYLNAVEAGGATVFPDAQLQVVPRPGSAVFFNYSRAHPCSRTLHGGAPVVAGEKWIATKWLREREFA